MSKPVHFQTSTLNSRAPQVPICLEAEGPSKNPNQLSIGMGLVCILGTSPGSPGRDKGKATRGLTTKSLYPEVYQRPLSEYERYAAGGA